MDDTPKEAFDLEAVYDAEIAPLMDKIIAVCKEHKLPMFATFLYQNDPDDGDNVCTTNLMFKERPIPEKLLQLVDMVTPRRVPPLRIRVTKADGSVEETVVMG
jgi:hypothetical protein